MRFFDYFSLNLCSYDVVLQYRVKDKNGRHYWVWPLWTLAGKVAAKLPGSGEQLKNPVLLKKPSMDRAIPFIQLVRDKWIISEDAARVLSAVSGKVAVIAVAGLYRYGMN